MRYLKMLGAAVVAAVALASIWGAGTALATELYSGATTLKAGTSLEWSLKGTLVWETTEGTVLDQCSSGAIKNKTTNNGSSTETVKASIESMTWSNCTEPTATAKVGGLEMHWTSGLNGTVTAGAASEITVNTTIFGSCVFTIPTGGTIGTITGTESGNATVDINAVGSRVSGLCPSSFRWTGSLVITFTIPFRLGPS